ncbi:MAG: prolyl aminopeptidase [Gammaproteobacteria bacterium]|jgi:proline iminopeptidase|nr:prolyl aminopeptidase [Gammaproteobacteria bacterium]MBT5541671.1 prolyl aminopeptidase [Gammaproteobacteria bacterium]
MTDQLKLFPHCMPYNTGYYSADNHEIYYEESGNPSGKPALFLHGGPGGGGDINVRRFFDPKIYRIITFDQRGCGRSKPNGLLINNTTWDLISDIEALRLMFDIDKWLVFGGSWGSTLALAYSQTHPSSVSEMILRGIFLLRKKELKWFYQEGASNIFPEAWQNFIELIEPSNRHDLMQAYYDIFQSDNENLKLKAAIAWSKWEGTTCSLSYDESRVDQFSDPHFALAFALIENHYFINRGFFETEDQLINGISKIRSIPTVIVQGRYDMVCPMETAWEVSRNWLEASLVIAPFSGHTAFEKEITHELIKATNEFGKN